MSGRPPKATDQSTFTGQIAARIRARRLKAKLRAEDAATAARVPLPTWYAWESGRFLPLDALPRIAEALGCRVRYLVGD